MVVQGGGQSTDADSTDPPAGYRAYVNSLIELHNGLPTFVRDRSEPVFAAYRVLWLFTSHDLVELRNLVSVELESERGLEFNRRSDLKTTMLAVLGYLDEQAGQLNDLLTRCKWSRKREAIELVTKLRSDIKKERAQVDQFPASCTVIATDLDDQMDSASASAVTGKNSDDLAKVAVDLGKVALRSFEICDSPAVPIIDATSMALSDIPRPLLPIAFKTGDRVNAQSRNFAQTSRVDVMDIQSRCAIPGLIAQIQWNTTQVVGTELLGPARTGNNYASNTLNAIAPGMPFGFGGVGVGNSVYHTYQSFISQFFDFVRCDYEFIVETINTTMHQGQLYVAMQPFTGVSVTEPTLSQARNCYGATLDLSKCNRTQFNVPYNSFGDYIYTYPNGLAMQGSQPTLTGSMASTYRPACNGFLYIYVQNPLTGPSTVSTTIEVNVWMALKNLEFFSPRAINDSFLYAEDLLSESNPADAIPLEMDNQMERSADAEIQQSQQGDTYVSMPPTGPIKPSTKREVATDVNVARSDYKRIMSRDYLLVTGVLWNVGQVRGTGIFLQDIAPMFESTDLFTSAMFPYNGYYRTCVEMSVRANGNLMMSGLLAVVHMPVGCVASSVLTIPQIQQYVVGWLTPQTDTKVTIQIPWTHVHRVVNPLTLSTSTNPNYLPTASSRLGQLFIVVFAPLRTGTGGSNSISMSVWGRLVDPYIGFKRANVINTRMDDQMAGDDGTSVDAVEQGDPIEAETEGVSVDVENAMHGADKDLSDSTDTMMKTECGGSIIPRLQGPSRGYLRTNHTNMRALMRRPHYMTSISLPPSSGTAGWQFLAGIACRPCNPTIQALLTTVRAWSGQFRYHFVCNAGQATQLILKARWWPYHFVTPPAGVDLTPVAIDLPKDFSGSVVWRPGEENVKVIQMARYHPLATSFIPSPLRPNATPDYQFYEAYGTIILTYNNVAINSTSPLNIDIYQSIGDDFNAYVPWYSTQTTMRALPVGFEESVAMQRNTTPRRLPVIDRKEMISVRRVPSVDQGWVRDLTREGVEPNPGPHDSLDACLDCELAELCEETGNYLPMVQLYISYCRSSYSYWRDRIPCQICIENILYRWYTIGPDCDSMGMGFGVEAKCPHRRTRAGVRMIFKQVLRMALSMQMHVSQKECYEHMQCESEQCIWCLVLGSMWAGKFQIHGAALAIFLFAAYFKDGPIGERRGLGFDFGDDHGPADVPRELVDAVPELNGTLDCVCVRQMRRVYVLPVIAFLRFWKDDGLDWFQFAEDNGNFAFAVCRSIDEKARFAKIANIVRDYNDYCNKMFVRDKIIGSRHVHQYWRHVSAYSFKTCRAGILSAEEIFEPSLFEIPDDPLEGVDWEKFYRTEEEQIWIEFGGFLDDQVGDGEPMNCWEQIQDLFRRFTRWTKSKYTQTATRSLQESCAQVYDAILHKYLPLMSMATDLALNLYTIIRSQSAILRSLALAALGTKLIKTACQGGELLQQLTEGDFSSLFRDEDECMSVATKLGVSAAVAVCVALLSAIGVTFGSKDATDLRKLALFRVGEAANTVSKITNGVRAVPNLWRTVQTGVTTGIQYMLEGRNIFDDWLRDNREKCTDWQRQWDSYQLVNRFDNNNLFREINGEVGYTRLLELETFARSVRTHSTAVGFPILWTRTAAEVLKMAASARKLYDTALSKIEPVCLWLQGAPGIGKSFLASSLIPFCVMMELGMVPNAEEAMRQTWGKPTNPDQAFYDGYASQKFVICDDFLASAEDKDALEMINLASLAKVPIPMADLSEKRTVFDSPFIIATTNQKSVQAAQSIKDKPALIRRFGLAVELTARPAFAEKGKVDLQKAVESFSACRTVGDLVQQMNRIWVVKHLDLYNGQITNDDIGVGAIVGYMTSEYIKRNKVNTRLDRILEKIVAGPVADGATSVKQVVTADDQMMKVPPPVAGPLNEAYRLFQLTDCKDEFEIRDYDLSDEEQTEYSEAELRVPDMNPRVIQARMAYLAQHESMKKCNELTPNAIKVILSGVQVDAMALGYGGKQEMMAIAAQMPTQHCMFSPTSKYEFGKFVRYLQRSLLSTEKEQDKTARWIGLAKHIAVGLGIAAGAAAVAYSIYTIIKAYCTQTVPTEAEDEGVYDSGGARQPQRSKAKGIRKLMRDDGLPYREDVVKRIQKNMHRIEIGVGNDRPYGLYALALTQDTIVVPEHFYQSYLAIEDDDKQIRIEAKAKGGRRVAWLPLSMTPLNSEVVRDTGYFSGKRDARIVCMVDQILPNVKSIMPYLMTRADKLARAGTEFTALWLEVEHLDKAVVSFGTQYQKRDETSLAAKVNVETKNGDCGRPYVLRNIACQRPLVGIHVWGKANKDIQATGVADLSFESVRESIVAIESRIYVPASTEPFDIFDEPVELDDQFGRSLVAGTSDVHKGTWNDVKLVRYLPTKTAFDRTDLKNPGDWEDEYSPAVTGFVGGEHTLYGNMIKFEPQAQMTVPVGLHEQVLTYMQSRVDEYEGQDFDLTEDEVINGSADYSPIVMDTSPGFLSYAYAKGKSELFDELPQVEGEPIKYKFSEAAYTKEIPHLKVPFMVHYRTEEARILRGEEPHVLWVAVNKDELLLTDKVRRGKVRVFVAPELTHTLLQRKKCGRFIAYMKKHMGFKMCHAIGCDKDVVWGAMRKRFYEVGERGFDVDYSNFDGTETIQGFNVVLALMDKFYSRGGERVSRAALVRSITHSYVVTGYFVVQTIQGNKSGNAATDIFNSIVNWYNMLVCFLVSQKLMAIPRSIQTFTESVRCLTYGDDVIVTASNEVLHYYNRRSCANVLSLMGYTITGAQKESGELNESEDFSELTFLKSPFVVREGFVASPLPLKVIGRELLWGKRRNAGDQEIMQMKVDAGVRMMCHHGEEKANRLIDQLKEQGWTSRITYKEWMLEMVDKQENQVVEGAVVEEIRVGNYFEDSLDEDPEDVVIVKDFDDEDSSWDDEKLTHPASVLHMLVPTS